MFGGNNPPTGTTSFTSTTKSSGFSFGTPVSGSGGGFSFGGTSQPALSAGTTPGFSFGGTTGAAQPSATSNPGFSFGGTNQAGGFSLTGTGQQSTATSGFSLSGTTQASTAPACFSLGGTTQASTAAAGFSLGGTTQASSASTGFSLGGTTQASAAPAGFSLGGTTQASTAPAGFSLGGTTQASTATTGLSFGGSTQASASSSFSLSGTTTQPSATKTMGGFNLPTQQAGVQPSTQPASAGFNLPKPAGQTAPQPTATGGFGLTAQPTLPLSGLAKPTQPTLTGTQPTSTAVPGLFGGALKVGATTGAATTSSTVPSTNMGVTSGFSIGGASTSAAPALGGLEKPKTATVGFSLPTSAAASSGSAVPQKDMNYQQLEENINKWMQDLEKQEKEFLEQATHVNAWDRLLVENGEKITSLNSDMERVKVEQQKLDHELDFIKAQQKELEELLVPLEKSVEEQPNISFQQHADLERENTYQLAENIDAQLKRMLQDLKEIIDHLNTSNASQDNTDPIYQITQILNSHMDSLQWIDQNSALLKRHVEDISKQMETQRKEQEKNFRLVYN